MVQLVRVSANDEFLDVFTVHKAQLQMDIYILDIQAGVKLGFVMNTITKN